MKRTYFLVILILFSAFAGCSAKTYTPVLQTQFDLNAVYKTGDFSYDARIVRNEEGVFITPLSSYAAGMTISCDGKTVTFTQGDFVKSFDKSSLDSTNPAILLYEVFSYLEALEKVNSYVKDEDFVIKGKTSIGTFTLIQSKNNKMKSLSIPDANIEIEFKY